MSRPGRSPGRYGCASGRADSPAQPQKPSAAGKPAGDAGTGGHDMSRKPADAASWLCFLTLLAVLAVAEELCAALAYDTLGEVTSGVLMVAVALLNLLPLEPAPLRQVPRRPRWLSLLGAVAPRALRRLPRGARRPGLRLQLLGGHARHLA